MDAAIHLNNLAASAQRSNEGDRAKAVHALADALLSASPHLLAGYLHMMVEFARAKDAATRQVVAVFLGLLLCRDTGHVPQHSHALLDLLSDVAPAVVESSAAALRSLLTPAMAAVIREPSLEGTRALEYLLHACRMAVSPFFRPQQTGGCRAALVDLLVHAAAVSTPPHTPPAAAADAHLAASNAVDARRLPPALAGILHPPTWQTSFAERLVSVVIAGLFRDSSDARAAVREEEYAYAAHRVVRLAVWRPVLADACARALSVLCYIPPGHVSRCVAGGGALSPGLLAAVRSSLVEAVATVQDSGAAQKFSALLAAVDALSRSPTTEGSSAPPCPPGKPLVLNPDAVLSLAPADVVHAVLANIFNPPEVEVLRQPLSDSAATALDGLLSSIQAAQSAEAAAHAVPVPAGDEAGPPGTTGSGTAHPASFPDDVALAKPGVLGNKRLALDSRACDDALGRILHLSAQSKTSRAGGTRHRAAIIGPEGQAAADAILGMTLHLLTDVASSSTHSAADPSTVSVERLLAALSPKNGPVEPATLKHAAGILVLALHRAYSSTTEHLAASRKAVAGMVDMALGRRGGVGAADWEDSACEALSRLLLDLPVVDWPSAVNALLQVRDDAQDDEAMDDGASGSSLRVAVSVLGDVILLRPSARLVALEALLALLASAQTDLEVAEAAHEAVSHSLHSLDETSQSRACEIAVSALHASARLPGGDDAPDAKRSRSDKSLSHGSATSCFQAASLASLPVWVEAVEAVARPEVSDMESLSLLRLYLSVAHGCPAILVRLLPWAAVFPQPLRGGSAHVAVITAAARTMATKFGLVTTLQHVVGNDPVPIEALTLLRTVIEALTDVGVTMFALATKRVEQSAGDMDEAADDKRSVEAHPREDPALQALIVAVSKLTLAAQASHRSAAGLLSPLIALVEPSALPETLVGVFAQAVPGDVRYTIARLLHTPACPAPAALDTLFSTVISAADTLAARGDLSGQESVRLLTEVSSGLFDDRATYSEKMVQGGLQRVVLDAVEARRRAPTRSSVLPVLSMRCFAVAARMYPELRTALVEQLLGLLRAAEGGAFEPVSTVQGWPSEEAVAAGPRWHGFTRFVTLTVPVSFVLLAHLPEPYLALLVASKADAELRRRAVKWFSTYSNRAASPAFVRRLLAAEDGS